MCGIVGIFYFDREARGDHALLERMVQTLAHRGPDDRGTFIDQQINLGMTRLSIIDVAGGHQPMFNEDKSKVIVFNGEIYNFQELRNILLNRGHIFRSRSDTEVILHAFEEWGEDCVLRFNGIFAFAIWDAAAKRLFLVRDHLGVKPLYYWFNKDCFIFASEIKAILQHPAVARVINPQGLRNYFAFGHSIGPDTIYQGIKKLLPGHRLSGQVNKEIAIEKYWDISWREPLSESETALAERILCLLEESVTLQLMSDVPLGAFLSGGIDSSSIVALMAKGIAEPVKTFSVGFQQADTTYNELDDALTTAQFLKTDHHVIEARPADFIEVLQSLVYHYDEPFADAACFPTYLVAKLAREHVKVVLTGDGADELFGGYRRYDMDSRLTWSQLLPASILNFIFKLGQPVVRNHPRWQRGLLAFREKEAAARAASWYVWFSKEMCAELFKGSSWEKVAGLDYLREYRNYYAAAQSNDRLNRMMYADLKTQMVDSYLEKIDKATMAVGLEARVPFLDYRLVELAFRIPSPLKIKDGQLKTILRQTLQGILPVTTLEKPKHGFAVPFDQWMRQGLKTFVAEILFDQRTQARGFFNPRVIERYYADHINGRAGVSTQLWFMMVFEVWCRTFLDQ